jgi:hypothetical protein
MTERVKAWECIGCGTLDAKKTCIGVCEYRKVELVHAQAHDDALAAARRAQARSEALLSVVNRLARTTPHEGEWQRSYLAIQRDARLALGALDAMAATA